MFNPTTNFQEAMQRAFSPQLFPWDEYFAQMAKTDVLSGSGEVMAAKSFFIRKAPFDGSYALVGGITQALNQIQALRFDNPEFVKGMTAQKHDPRFIEWLRKEGGLRLQLYAPPEGGLMFPNEPIITAVGPLPHIRLVEGIITEAVNFSSLSLTKWHRLIRTIRPGSALEFARRRAQNAAKTTVNAMLAGCFASSNSEMGRFFDFRITGTMGHEWIQRFGDVKEAFNVWLEHNPDRPIGLVDTINCLKVDFPAWLDAVSEHQEAIREANPATWGWRNDSGDLAYLTIEQYRMANAHPISKNEWFRERMRVTLTNDLDEYSAKTIIEQIRSQAGAAGLDAEDILRRIIWAAGTRPGTVDDQPSLGGVMKLVEVDGHECLKLAFDADGMPGIKTSIPGFNRSALIRDSNGEVAGVLIYPHRFYQIVRGKMYLRRGGEYNEITDLNMRHPDNPASSFIVSDYHATSQQELVWDSLGTRNGCFAEAWDQSRTVSDIANGIMQRVDGLHWSMTRLEKPHRVKVSLTSDLFQLRRRMIEKGALRADFL